MQDKWQQLGIAGIYAAEINHLTARDGVRAELDFTSVSLTL